MAKRIKNKKTATGNSPYKKYGKKPYVYSDAYRQWFKSVHQNIRSSASVNS